MKPHHVLRRGGWPLGSRFFPLSAGCIAALVWFGTRGQLEWRALDWARTSAEFTAQLRFPAIVAAAAASHVAARLTHRTRIFAQPWSVRVGRPLLKRHLCQLLSWFVPAYLLGMVPLVWTTTRRAEYGRPDALVILGALLGFVALIAFGYLVGTLVQNLLAVPTTVALVFLLVSLPNVADGWNALVPTMSALPTLGREQSLTLSLYRLLAFAVFGALFCWLAVHVLTRRRPVRAAQAPLLLIPVALVAFPLMRTPALFSYSPGGTEICDSRDGVTYCVHEGHRSELTQVRDLAAPIIAAYGPGNTPVRHVRDYSLATSDADVRTARESGTLWVYIAPGWKPAEEVPLLVAAMLVPGKAACTSAAASIDPGASTDERRAYLLHDLTKWLEGRAFPRGGVRAELFTGATPEQVRRWIAQERRAIETCTADPEELPWR